MNVSLRIRIEAAVLWDTIEVTAWDSDDVNRYFRMDVYAGNDRRLAINKAFRELEELLTKIGWMEPGIGTG